MIDWDDLRYYLIAAQAGTVTAAADILKVNRTTVTRRVEALERDLGLALYEQTPLGPGSTDIGREVLACARDVESRIHDLLDTLSLVDRHLNMVRISIPAELGLDLIPAYDAIRSDASGAKLEFIQSIRPDDDLRERRTLIGLCVNTTLPAHLKGVAISTVVQRPYAILNDQRSPVPSERSWIGWGRDMEYCAGARWMRTNIEDRRIALRVNSGGELKEAVRRGLGIGYLWDRMASETDLVAMDTEGPALTSKLWLVMHEDVPPAPLVQKILHNLEAVLKDP